MQQGRRKGRLRAVLTYKAEIDGRMEEQARMFDTEKARKICDVKNSFGNKVKEMYMTGKGVIFQYDVNGKALEVADQRQARKWVGEHEPDRYIEFFGEVQEG